MVAISFFCISMEKEGLKCYYQTKIEGEKLEIFID